MVFYTIIPLYSSPFSVLGLGVTGYALLSRFKRGFEDKKKPAGGEDLELPLVLEYEYGNFRKTCFEVDPVASAYLKVIPENYFHFNQNFLDLILTHFSSKVRLSFILLFFISIFVNSMSSLNLYN